MPGASQPSAAGAPNGAAAAAAAGTWSNQPRDRQGGDISLRKSIHYYKILNDYTICACFNQVGVGSTTCKSLTRPVKIL